VNDHIGAYVNKVQYSDVFKRDVVHVDAPWCGHCQKLAPEYAAAATRLADDGSTVRLAKIDAALYGDVAARFAVARYPTLKLFVDSLETFEFVLKERTASVIVRWLKKRLAKYPADFVQSVHTAHRSISSNQLVAFGFFEVGDTVVLNTYSFY